MAPSNLQLTSTPGLFSSSTLSWSRPRAGNPASYAVFGDGKVLGSVPAIQTTFDVSPKSGEPGSVYQVVPLDRFGAVGPASNPNNSGSGPAPGPYNGAGSDSRGVPSTPYGPSSGPGAGIASSNVNLPPANPLAPSNLALSSFNGSGPGSATLSWNRPSQGAPSAYSVLKDGKPVAAVPGGQTSVPVSGLPTNGGASTLQVVPFDSNGVAGPASSPLAASLPSDPSSGIALTSTPVGTVSSPGALLAWTTPSGLGNVPSFGVLQDGRQVATAKASPSGVNTFAPKGLSPSAAANSYFSVVPLSSSGSPAGPASNSVPLASYPAGSGAGPASPADMAPSNLQLTSSPGLFGSSGRLSWSPPRAGSPASYAVVGNGKVLGTVPASQTSQEVPDLSPSSVYQVLPVASNGAVGPASSPVTGNSATTGAPGAGSRSSSVPFGPLSPSAGPGAGIAGSGVEVPSSSPLAPSNLALSSFNGSGPGSATLSWNRPIQGAPASFTVLKDGKPVAAVPGGQTSAPVSGLPTNGGASTLQVVPFDSNGVAGPASLPLTASLPSDPSSGIALTSTPAGSGSSPSALLSWTTPTAALSSEAGGLASFAVMQDGNKIASVPPSLTGVNSFPVKGLSPSAVATSRFSVVPLSPNGSPIGQSSNSVPLASYAAGSGAGPASPAEMMPTNLQLTSAPGLFSSSTLSWSRPRAGNPASYAVVGDGQFLGAVPAIQTSFEVSPKSGEPGSVYQVVPLDSFGTAGPSSKPASSGSGPSPGPYNGAGDGPLFGTSYPYGPSSGPGAGIANSGANVPAPSPLAPSSLALSSFNGSGPGSATLSWKRPASGSPASYTVLKDGKPVASVPGGQTSAPVSGLPTNGGASTLQVVPFDSNGVAGPASSPLAASLPSDPSSGIALTSTPVGTVSSPGALLAWTTPSGLGNVPSFGVLQDGRQVATAKASPSGVNTFAPKGLSPSAAANSYFSVVPLSSSGSPAGPASNSVPLASYPAGSSAGPASPADMAPSNLQLTSSPGLFGSSGRLSWSPPRAGSPASYSVIGDGKVLGSVPANQTTFDVSPKSGEPGSVYQVVPVAANGAVGPASNTATSGSGPAPAYSGAGAPGYNGAGADPYGPSTGPGAGIAGSGMDAPAPSPLAPSSLALSSFNGSGPGSATLSWKRPASGSPASYTVLKDGKPVASVPGGQTSVPVLGLPTNGGASTLQVVPFDSNGVAGPASSPLAASLPSDPSSGIALTSTSSGAGSNALLAWTTPSGLGNVPSFGVLQDGRQVATAKASPSGVNTFAPKGLSPSVAANSYFSVVPLSSSGSPAGPASNSVPLASYPTGSGAGPASPADMAPSNLQLTSSPGLFSSSRLSWNRPRAGSPASYSVIGDGKVVPVAANGAVGPASNTASSGSGPAPAYSGAGAPGYGGPGAGPYGPSSGPGAGIANSGVDAPAPSPLAPSSLALSSFNGSGPGSATLSWKRPASGSPASYTVLKDGKPVASVPGGQTSVPVLGLPTNGGASTLQVVPFDSNGVAGPASSPLAASLPSDPSSGIALTSTPAGSGSSPSALLAWTTPSGLGNVPSFGVLQDGRQVATAKASPSGVNTFAPKGLSPSAAANSYFSVVPLSSSGSPAGPASNSVPLASYPAGSGAGPASPADMAPSNLQLTSSPGLFSSSRLSWNRPRAGNPASYSVIGDGKVLGSVPANQTTFDVSPKSGEPGSVYQVVPVAANGAVGPASNPASSSGSGYGPGPYAGVGAAALSGAGYGGAPAGSDGLYSSAFNLRGDGAGRATSPSGPSGSGSFGGAFGPASPSSPGAGIAGSGVDAPAPSPLAPSSLGLSSFNGSGLGSATLSWKRPASGSPASYTVLKDGKPVAAVPGGQTSVPVSGLPTNGGASTLQVVPFDSNGVAGPASSPLAASLPSDPSSGIALTSTSSGAGSNALLAWTTPSGLGNVPSFGVLQDGRQVATAKASPSGVNTFAPKGLSPSAAANSYFSVPASYSVIGDGKVLDSVPANQTTFDVSPKSGEPGSVYQVVPVAANGARSRRPGYGGPGAGPYGPSTGPGAGIAGSGVDAPAPSPLAPSSLALSSFNGSGPGSATLSWKRPASGSPASYTVLKDGKPVASVPGGQTSVPVSGLPTNGGALTLQVVPFDSNGVAGPASSPLAASLPSDPSSGIALTSTPAGSGSSPSALLAWTTPSGLGNVPSFGVLQDGRQVATAKASPSGVNTFAPKGLSPSAAANSYFSVVPLSSSGSPAGPASNSVPLASYPAGSGAGPASPADMAPSNLQLTSSPGLFSSSRLSWNRPRAGSPASYSVIGDGKVLGSVPANQTTFDVSPKSGEPGSVYQVMPVAANGAVGPASNPASSSGSGYGPGPYAGIGAAALSGAGYGGAPAGSDGLYSSASNLRGDGAGRATSPSGPSGSGSFGGAFGPASPSSPGAGIAGSGVDAPAPSPLAPSSLALSSFNGSGPGSATLSWKRPASGSPASYTVLKDGKPVAAVPGGQTSVPVLGLPTNGGASTLQVVPFDSNGVAGPASSPLAASLPSDPSSGIALTSTPAGSGSSPSALLAWTTPSGLGNVPSFGVLQDGRQVATAKASPSGVNTFAPKGLSPSAAANSYFSVVPLSSSGSPAGPASNSLTSSPGLFSSSRLSWNRPRQRPANQTTFDVSPKSGEPGSVYQVVPVAANGAVGPASNTASSGSGPAPAYSGAGAPGYGGPGAGPYGPSTGPGAGIAGSGVDAPAPSPLAPSSLALSSFNGSGGAVRQQWRRGPGLVAARGLAAERPELRHRADVDAGGLRLQPSALLAWTTPSGLGNVPSFGVLQDGRQVATAKASPSGVNTFAPKGLSPSAAANSYFSVVPLSSSGSPAGPASNSVPLASYPAGSGAGPASPADMAPSNLQLTSSPGLFGSSGRLSWNRPRAGSPASYSVIGDGKVLGSVPANQTTFDVSPKSGEPGSVYQVMPVAANGAVGPASNLASSSGSGYGPGPYAGIGAAALSGAGYGGAPAGSDGLCFGGAFGPASPSSPGAGIAGSGVDAPAPSPLAPSSLGLSSFNGSGPGSATLSWKRPASGSPASYTVLKDGKPVAAVPGGQTSVPVSGLPTNGGASTLQVVPFDSNGVAGPASSPLAASLPSDPSSGIALTSTPAGSGSSPSALLAWTTPSGLGNVPSFGVLQDGRQVATAKASPSGVNTFAPKGLSPSAAANSYFSVVPLSSSGSPAGPASNSVPLASYPAGSGAGPASPADMAPSNLQLTSSPGLFSSSRLSWNRPRAGSPASYSVIGDGKVLGSVPANQTTFDVSPKSGEPGSVYQVVPVAANGAVGPASNTASSGSGPAPAYSGASVPGYGGAAADPYGPSSGPGAGIAGSGVDAPAPSPLAPSSLGLSSFNGSGLGSATLSWKRPASGSPASYTVLKDGKPVAAVPGGQTSVPVSGLPTNGGASTLQVVPFDSNGVAGPASSPLAASLPSDPSSGIALTSTSSGAGSNALLAWTTPSGLGNVPSFGVLQDGRQVATAKASPSGVNTFAPKGLSPSAAANSYFSVVPLSSLGSPAGPASNSVPLASYPAGSGAGPASPADMAPSNLQLTSSPGLFSSSRLSWNRPRAGSPASYSVIGDGKVLDSVPANQTTFDVSPKSGEPGSVYQVVPVAANGAVGPASNTASSGSGPAPAYSGAGAPGYGGPGAGPYGPSTGPGAGIAGSGVDAPAPSPLAPSSLALSSFNGSGPGSATLSWKRPASGSPASYTVLKDGKPVASVPGGQTSQWRRGPASSPLAASLPSDPSSGIALTSTPAGSGSSPSALLAWTTPSGLGNVPSFGVLQDGRQVATAKASPSGVNTFAPKGLSPSAAPTRTSRWCRCRRRAAPQAPPATACLSPRTRPAPARAREPRGHGALEPAADELAGPLLVEPPLVEPVPANQTTFDVSPKSGEPGSVYQVMPVAANGALRCAFGPASPSSPGAGIAGSGVDAPAPSPLAPSSLALSSFNGSGPGSATLSWKRPASGSPASYTVLKDGKPVAAVPGGQTSVVPFDSNGVAGPASSPLAASLPSDPSSGIALTSTPAGSGSSPSALLAWTTPSGLGNVPSFGVLQDGRQVATAKASPSGVNTFAPKGLSPSAAANSYFSVVPLSSSGSPAGPASNSVPLASYPAGSGAGPASPADMAPSNLQLTSSPGLFSSSRLSWNRPRAGSPASYSVIGDGKVLGSVPANQTTFDVSPKSGEPGSVYQVVPVAANGARSRRPRLRWPWRGPVWALVWPWCRHRRSGVDAPAPSPLAPSSLALSSFNGSGPGSATLSWKRPASGSPASYTVLKDGKPVASVPGGQTSVPVSGLPTNGGASTLQVVPFDSNGVAGPASSPLAASLPSDPSSGIALTSTPAGSGSSPSALLAWTTPSGLGNVPSFGVLQDGRQVATAKASPSGVNTFAPKGLSPSAAANSYFSVVPLSSSGSPAGPASNSPASYSVIGDGKVLGSVPANQTTFDVSPKSGEPGSVYQVMPVAANGAVGPASNLASSSGSGYGPGPYAGIGAAALSGAGYGGAPAGSDGLCSFNGSGPGSATLSWKRPASGSPASYTVLKDGKPVAAVPGGQTSVPVSGLPTNGGASTLQVVPFDSNGVAGPASSPLAASLPSDPSSGIALTSTPAGSGSSPSALLAWTTPSGLGNVPSFGVLQDGRQVATAKASPSGVNTFAPKGLSPSAAANSYFSVVPLSSSGSPAGPASNSVPLASYPAGSGAGPASPADMAPSNLQLTSSPGLFSSSRLSWNRPRAGSPASYSVIGDGKVLGSVPANQTTFDVSPKSGEPGSVYQVVPVAANGAVGPASNTASSGSGPAPAYSGASVPGYGGAAADPYGPSSGPGAGIANSGVDAPAPSPLAPSSLALSSFNGSGPGSTTLSWKRPASGSPASYTVLKDGKPVASVPGGQTSVPVSGLPTNGGASTLQVVPFDSNGVAGPASSPLAASLPSDPSSGIALTSTPAGSGSSPSALLAWTTPSGLGNVPSFGVLQDGRQVATAKASPSGVNTFAPKGLSPSAAANSYFSVVPLSSSGSPAGPASNSVPLASYPAGSGAGPASPADMAPSNLQLTSSPGLFSSSRLSWNRPRAGSPASYSVIGDGKVLGSVPANQTTFDVSPKSGEPGSVYQVMPVAANGAVGPALNPASSSGSGYGLAPSVARSALPARRAPRRHCRSGVDAPAPSPLAPSSLALSSFNGSGPGSATLSWKRPASGSPASYTVLKDGKPVASVPGGQTSVPVSGLPTNGGASTLTLQVVPFDSNGVAGPASSPLAASLPSDPSSGIALTSTPAGSGSSPSALLAWTTPSGLGNVPSFGVLQDGRQVATAKASPSGVNTFAPKGLSPSAAANSYFSVVPLSSSGSPAGPASNSLTSSPGLFSSSRLSWNRPRAGSPASYSVIGDGKVLGSVPANQTTFDVSPKSGEPGSVYQVVPVAANGAVGPASNTASSGSGPAPAYSGAGAPGYGGPGAGPYGPSSGPGAGIANSGVDAPAPSPLAPSSLALSSFNGSGPGSATLSWKRPASGSPASYTVLKDGKPVASVPGGQTSVPVSGLPTNGGASTLQVVPFDSNGVAGPASSPLAASLPSDPSSIALTSTPAGSGSSPSALLAWTTPSGLGNVPSFGVLQDGRQVATAKASPSGVNTFAPKGLSPSAAANSYFSVVPLSSSGSPAGPASNSVPLASYPAGSGAGPASPADMAPSNLQLTSSPGLFGSSGRLSWSPPRAGSPASYSVIGDGKVLGSVPANQTTFDVSPKSGEPGRVYQVVPVAANGAVGPASNPVSSGSSRGSGFAPGPYAGVGAAALSGAGYGAGGAPTGSDGSDAFNRAISMPPTRGSAGPGSSSYGAPAPFAAPSAATLADSDVSGPAPDEKAPSNLRLTSAGGRGGSSSLSWSHPATGPANMYAVMANGKVVSMVPGTQTTILVPAAAPGSSAKYQVVPMGASGIAETASFPLAASAPSDPSSALQLTATPSSASSATLKWNRPTGKAFSADRLQGYNVIVNGATVATVPPTVTVYELVGVPPSPVVSVVPVTASGPAPTAGSSPVVVPDPTEGQKAAPQRSSNPAAPSNVQLTNVDQGIVSNTTGTLTWDPPANGPPAEYMVLQNGLPVGKVPGNQTSYQLADLPTGQMTEFTVQPVSAAGVPGPASPPCSSICLPCKLAAMLGK
eukprot:tig00000180_g13623.t1